MKKNSLLFSFCFASFLILLFTAFISQKHLITLLDLFFYIGITLLLIGSILLIIQGGFFTRFLNNTRRFYSTINKREQVIQYVEGRSGRTSSYSKKFPIIAFILPLGVIFFLLSLIGSVITVQLGR